MLGPTLRSAPRRWVAVGGLVFLTAGYFQNSRPGWNVNSQFALTCALVERGELTIDAYHELPETATGDKAFKDGHYYCDKSPVTSLLGVPAMALYSVSVRAAGRPVDYHMARYWTTWLTIGVAAAALTMMLAAALERRGVDAHWASAMAGLWWLATPLLGYSVLFMSYLPACALGLAGWMLIEPLWIEAAAQPPSRATIRRRAGGGGVAMGLAAWTLPTMAVPALVATLVLILAAQRAAQPGARLRGVLAWLAPWCAGGLVGVAAYGAYQYAVFGSLAPAYRFEADPFFREQMSRGLMGAGVPRAVVAWLVTFHPFQGLFCWFPITLVALAGAAWQVRRRGSERLGGLMALGTFAGLLLYTSGYYMWWGGWSYAPRHLVPALPWMALGFAAWLHGSRPPAWRWACLGLGAIGAVFNVAAVALDPQPPPDLPQWALLRPQHMPSSPETLAARALATLRRGSFAQPAGIPWDERAVETDGLPPRDRWPRWTMPFLKLQHWVWVRGEVDRNWGQRLGLRGAASLLPLYALWVLGLAGLLRRGGRNPAVECTIATRTDAAHGRP